MSVMKFDEITDNIENRLALSYFSLNIIRNKSDNAIKFLLFIDDNILKYFMIHIEGYPVLAYYDLNIPFINEKELHKGIALDFIKVFKQEKALEIMKFEKY